VVQLQRLYASMVREFYYARTGKESTYGQKGTELQLYGGYISDRRVHVPSPMLRLADFFLDRQIEPLPYMQCIFRKWRSPTPPQVNHLMSAQALGLYEDEMRRVPDELQRKLEMCDRLLRQRFSLNTLHHHMDEEQAAIRALLDIRIELSPLFRYCMAYAGNYAKIAAQFQNAALLEYTPLRDQYDQIWGDLIPKVLRDAARRNLQQGAKRYGGN